MAEAFETDAVCVGDAQMVMRVESYERQRFVTLTHLVSRYIWVLTEAGSLDLPFDLLELMGCSYLC